MIGATGRAGHSVKQIYGCRKFFVQKMGVWPITSSWVLTRFLKRIVNNWRRWPKNSWINQLKLVNRSKALVFSNNLRLYIAKITGSDKNVTVPGFVVRQMWPLQITIVIVNFYRNINMMPKLSLDTSLVCGSGTSYYWDGRKSNTSGAHLDWK